MEIHDLNTKALTDPAYVAFDDGEDTYKTEFNECVENAANAAVAAADLTENEVAFTSGDAASPTAWTNVSVITTGSTLATLFNRISTMVKNVRWLYSKLGTTDISSIGNGTVTGALSTLNGNLKTSLNTNDWFSVYNEYCQAIIRNGVVYVRGQSFGNKSIGGSDYTALTTLPEKYRPSATYYFPVGWSGYGLNMRINASGVISFAGAAQTYWNYFVAYPLF